MSSSGRPARESRLSCAGRVAPPRAVTCVVGELSGRVDLAWRRGAFAVETARPTLRLAAVLVLGGARTGFVAGRVSAPRAVLGAAAGFSAGSTDRPAGWGAALVVAAFGPACVARSAGGSTHKRFSCAAAGLRPRRGAINHAAPNALRSWIAMTSS